MDTPLGTMLKKYIIKYVHMYFIKKIIIRRKGEQKKKNNNKQKNVMTKTPIKCNIQNKPVHSE